MMRRAVASASFLLRKKGNIGAHTWDAYRSTWAKMAPIGRGRPRGEQGKLIRGLSVPGGLWGYWGERRSHYKLRAVFVLPIAKGRSSSRFQRPCSPSQVSPHPEGEDQQ